MQVYSLAPYTTRGEYLEVLRGCVLAPFLPKSHVKIAATEKEEEEASKAEPMDGGDEEKFAKTRGALEALTGPGFSGVAPLEFEKDDDLNGHVDFITAASNLRAANYTIQPADRNETKVIAGKIIPQESIYSTYVHIW